MCTNNGVNVIRAHGARPEPITVFLSSIPNRFSDCGTMLLSKPNDFVIEPAFRVAVELPELFARGLDALATLVDLSKFFQIFFAGFGRSTSARIVA
jgi:hypothetical protein